LEHDLKTFGKEDKKIRTSIFDAVPWRMKIKMNQDKDVVCLVCLGVFFLVGWGGR